MLYNIHLSYCSTGSDKTLFKSSYPEGVLYQKPLVVITDGLSASASEVNIQYDLLIDC